MKRIIVLLSFLLSPVFSRACPVCEQQQPKLLKGISHGAGPESNWDYAIIILVTAIVLITLFYSVKWLLRPGEQSENHIKRMVLNLD